MVVLARRNRRRSWSDRTGMNRKAVSRIEVLDRCVLYILISGLLPILLMGDFRVLKVARSCLTNFVENRFKELSRNGCTNKVFFCKKKPYSALSSYDGVTLLGVATVVWDCWKTSRQRVRASLSHQAPIRLSTLPSLDFIAYTPDPQIWPKWRNPCTPRMTQLFNPLERIAPKVHTECVL